MSVSVLPILQAVASAVLGLAAVWAPPSLAQGTAQQEDLSGFRAKPEEIALLPRYCWGTFNEKWRGPGMEAFNLPGGCGGRFNHFCPGMLSLARARTSVSNPQRRSYWLGVAADHMNYTVDGIKGFPACPMRGVVNATVQEIRTMQAAQR